MKTIRQKNVPYRNFLSDKKISLDVLCKLNRGQSVCTKPFGKWYSIRHYWLENLRLKMWHTKIDYSNNTPSRKYDISGKYLYEVVLNYGSFIDIKKKNKDKILIIKNSSDLITFSKKYGKEKDGDMIIDWCEVSDDYAGIEIPKMYKKLHDAMNKLTTWYYGWDIPSGVIWNFDVVSEINLIK